MVSSFYSLDYITDLSITKFIKTYTQSHISFTQNKFQMFKIVKKIQNQYVGCITM